VSAALLSAATYGRARLVPPAAAEPGLRLAACAAVLVIGSSAAAAQHCPDRRPGSPPHVTELNLSEMNGTRLAHEVRGAGSPVVLIHGGLVDSRLWDDQVAVLARRHRVIRYDLRGFGRSDFPEGPFSHVEDLEALLGHLGAGRVALVGVSLGGMIATDFALEHPDRVSALVLVGSALRGFETPPNEELAAIYRAAENDGRERAIDLWLRSPLFAGGRDVPHFAERVRAMLGDNFRSWGPTERPIEVRWPRTPTADRLSEIGVPTLVVAGDLDVPAILTIADALARGIAGAEKRILPGRSHHPNLEDPRTFNDLLLEFLRRAEGGPAPGDGAAPRPRA
jgi:pimeloyl-ACP methyl ester carboxylesterase